MKRYSRRPLVVGNWKMNGLRASKREISAVARRLNSSKFDPACEIVICPPATLLTLFHEAAKGTRLKVGAQDCHWAAAGAHTGDLSPEMLKDAGARSVIVGHSERRNGHGETSETVSLKAAAAHRAGLRAIICIGETEAERQAGQTLRVIGRQLAGSLFSGASGRNTVIAYEPVWAIGTGLTPTLDDIADVHGHIRKRLGVLTGEKEAAGMRVLYGGSVKPDNAGQILQVPNVDGALVGGASLKAADFVGIVAAYL